MWVSLKAKCFVNLDVILHGIQSLEIKLDELYGNK